MDLGTGDGRAVLARARAEPATLAVGLDADAAGMAEASGRATRERLGNALFVAAAVEALPAELAGRAGEVTVRLPWGSLLRAVASPDAGLLAEVRGLCTPGAAFEAVWSVDPIRDAAELARLGIGHVPWVDQLAVVYGAAGFTSLRLTPVSPDEIGALGTTWAKRLARNPGRRAWRLRARATGA